MANKIERDGKTVWLSEDGREYASKSGAWKRNKKLERDREASTPPEPKEATKEEPAQGEGSPSEPKVDWRTADFGDALEVEVIPAPLKAIRPRSDSKPTKKQLEAERGMNEGLLMTIYRSSDFLLTKYKRGVLDDPKADPISHSDEDYQWISGITQDALDDNGINMAGAIGPTGLAVAANSYWFGAPILRIQAEAKRSPFQGRVGGAIGRFVERIPIIGKRIKDRRLRTLQQEIEQDGEHS